MPRKEFVARIGDIGKDYVILHDIIYWDTGELFRNHCWVKWEWIKLPKQIKLKVGRIIYFKAKVMQYKTKKEIEMDNGVIAYRIVTQNGLKNLNSIEVIE